MLRATKTITKEGINTYTYFLVPKKGKLAYRSLKLIFKRFDPLRECTNLNEGIDCKIRLSFEAEVTDFRVNNDRTLTISATDIKDLEIYDTGKE